MTKTTRVSHTCRSKVAEQKIFPYFIFKNNKMLPRLNNNNNNNNKLL